ncbi:MAG TPA: polyprenyl synthetase family protein [Pyrinomonadaceae bacterium]
MNEQLRNYVAQHREEIEEALRRWLPVSSQPGAQRLNEALGYALFPGGKRLRPVFALLASRLAGATREQAMLVACAVEFIHTSSLILDDLPSMDDAGLRRNREALHLVYGEGLAVLAAVALLNQAYALLTRTARGCRRADAVELLLKETARSIGADGMVGGQVVDLELRAGGADMEAVASRDLKTVALMRLMMTAGALACDAAAADTSALARFGECVGRAYQICDDLLDGFGVAAEMGKPARQDARHLRLNSVGALGIEGAHRLAVSLVEDGIDRLEERFGARPEVRLLGECARLVLNRVEQLEPLAPAYAFAHPL